MCRHVNEQKVNEYWKECIRSIRRFHPRTRIVIIDDYSNPEMIDREEETRMMIDDPRILIIQSEYKGAGELLPYYYFHKHRWFDYAFILHDSVFINSSMTFRMNTLMKNSNTQVAFLWSFRTRVFDDNERISKYLELLDENEVLFSQRNSGKWVGCFGVMSCVKLQFIDKLVRHHQLFDVLLPQVKNRNDRMAMERVLSIVFQANLGGDSVDTLFGDIHDFCPWGYNYDDYKNNKMNHLPIIKVWTGR
jgi:hypothetical protein